VPPRRTITASFPPSLFERVEQARGLVSRSAWLQRAAEDFLIGRGALERETNMPASSGGGPSEEVIPGESGHGVGVGRPVEPASSSVRASVAQRIEGQTTVDEMLASCPQCAGELRKDVPGVVDGRDVMLEACVDCGWVRSPDD
jgi:hypothetical protein